MMESAPTRTLVFGDDGSPAADIAWLLINSHAWPRWQLEVVTARVPPIPSALAPDPDPPLKREAFAEASFEHVTTLAANTDPRLALLRPCDLLVVGPHGPGLLKSLHLGSTADWLLLHPPAPLLIARHGHRITNVIVCTDGSRHAKRVTEAIATLPWVDELDITVLAVDDSSSNVDEAVAHAQKQLAPTRAKVHVRVESGRPTRVIHDHINRNSTDLVALGTRGLTAFRHLYIGSTAGAIARTAPCNVLVACDEAEVPQPEAPRVS